MAKLKLAEVVRWRNGWTAAGQRSAQNLICSSITRPFTIFGHQNSFVSAIYGLVVIASQERAARTRLSRIVPMWHRLVSQSEF